MHTQASAWPFNGEGRLRFDAFAQRALFDPVRGYYGRNISSVGQKGDFSTSATLSDLLARGISDWIVKRPERLPVIEVGAGSGQLAEAILAQDGGKSSLAEAMAARLSLFAKPKIDYHIVEESQPLQQQQRERLRERVTWHSSLGAALESCGGRALIFSNELVDAFPPRVFRKEDEGWSELFLTYSLEEEWEAAERLPPSTVFERQWPVGQRVEVHDSFRIWQREQFRNFQEGEVLTIDYGESVDDLYHRQPGGSLRAFLHHQLLEGPDVYRNPGGQDLTCDVNFTDLVDWGEDLGLSKLRLQTQAEFLEPFSRGTTVDQYLIHTDGAGAIFKVLVQNTT